MRPSTTTHSTYTGKAMLPARLVAAAIAGDAVAADALSLEDVRALANKHAAAADRHWAGASPEEAAAVDSWLEVAFKRLGSPEQVARTAKDMDALLAGQSFLASKVWETAADIAVYGALAPHLPKLVASHPNLSRWASQMQQSVGAKTGAPSLLSMDLNTPKSIALLMAVDPKPQPAPVKQAISAPPAGAKGVAPASASAKPAAEETKPAKPAAEETKPAKPAAEKTKPAKPAAEEAKGDKPAADESKRKRDDKETPPAKKKDDAAEKKAPAAGAESEQLMATLLDIRVGKILTCEKHKEADQLYVETIDMGEAEPRTICSGLVPYYPSASDIQGKTVLVVCNLKSRNMKGVDSNGMVLAASDEAKTTVKLVEAVGKPGERVTYDGITGEPAQANVVNKKKILEAVLPGLGTDASGRVVYKDDKGVVRTVVTAAGPCMGGGITNGRVG